MQPLHSKFPISIINISLPPGTGRDIFHIEAIFSAFKKTKEDLSVLVQTVS